nr:hypothetical protein [Tanacetum cinerariifolium]
LFDSMLIQQGEGSGTPTEPHHTPSQEALPSSTAHISTSSIPTVISIPTITQSEPTPLRQYTRRFRIAQSSTLPPVADEPASPVRDVNEHASPVRDVSEGEACLTESGFIADQDRTTIAKISDDLEELARVLTSMDAATVLAGEIDVPTGSGSIPTAGPPAADIYTGSEVVPTATIVQIPKNNLDNLHSSREKDGTLESVDPQDLFGSFLLADADLIT